ncbi:MAG: hypothetical protein WD768_12385, partial [Phycisphaeraceae bacterium]
KGAGDRGQGTGDTKQATSDNPQSAIRNLQSLGPRPLAPGPLGVCAIGEIGLGGEIRHVSGIEQRIREAVRLGFSHVIAPAVSMKAPSGCQLIPVANLSQAMEMLG